VDWLTDPQAWIGLLTLTALEIVLGIDNVVFIAILAGKLPAGQQVKARQTGLLLAMVMRILLLFSLSWVIGLTHPLFAVAGNEISGRDLVLIIGGLFLVAKSTREIHEKLEGAHGGKSAQVAPSFRSVLIQIILLDIVFSLDSV
jgi:predicted tellurium resistance membrane protein TerC